MKKYANLLVIIFSLFFMIEFILNKELVFNTVFFSLNIWIKNIIPSLFPFFVISDILISYDFTKYLPRWFVNYFSYLFNVKEECVLLFFLSIISGFPSNAKNARKLYDMGMIDEKEASHILSFTHFSNPLFILGTVSVMFFNDKQIGIIILLSHYISNVFVGILFRDNGFDTKHIKKDIQHDDIFFGDIFINAIKSSIDTILLICGILTCFLVISAIIINTFSLNSLIVKSVLEITIGLHELSLYDVDRKLIVMFSSFILSFGGLSIHAQVKSQLIGTDISIKPFLIGRVYQSLISIVLAFIFYNIFI